MKQAIKNLIFSSFNFIAFFYKKLLTLVEFEKHRRLKLQFKQFGINSTINKSSIITNPKYISIGKNFCSLQNLSLNAIDNYHGFKYIPCIQIGNNVCFNTDCHIGAIEKVIIGNNVLFASKIYVSDHFHGQINKEALSVIPLMRELFSKGPVIIEDNVWVGEGVCIMPGVTIGKNAIIGANAVVTKSIPPNCVAVGIPAKVIKNFS